MTFVNPRRRGEMTRTHHGRSAVLVPIKGHDLAQPGAGAGPARGFTFDGGE